MSIVDMSTISIAGLNRQKEQLLSRLMKNGTVEIDDISSFTDSEEYEGVLTKDGGDKRELERKITDIGIAVKFIEDEAQIKKSIFPMIRSVENLPIETAESLYITALDVNLAVKKQNELYGRISTLKSKIEGYKQWEGYDLPLGMSGTKYSKIILGTAPSTAVLTQALKDAAPTAFVNIISEQKIQSFLAIMVHKNEHEEAQNAAKQNDFSIVNFEDGTKTATETIKICQDEIAKTEIEIELLKYSVKEKVAILPDLEMASDYFTVERDKIEAQSLLVKTRAAFYMGGFVPTENAEKVKADLENEFDCTIEIQAKDKTDDIPILVKNSRLVKPFEMVTAMYSLPNSSNMDPNPFVAFFFFIFFGMMLSDAGYGLILTAVTAFIIWKYKPVGTMGSLIRLICLCGISTMGWGIIFGGYFGDIFGVKPIIDPMKDVMLLMGLSLALGIVHIYVGLALKAYMLIRDRKFLDAAFDVGLWYIFLTGLVMLAIPFVAKVSPSYLADYGKWIAIVGASGLVLTQGRSKKNIFAKLIGGVSSLYDVTGYLGDLLSYTRLMALCLSTGVIANVVNLISGMSGPVVGAIVGIIFHTINLLINALGAFVHTSRLQYVEFFGKFYDGGGRPYTPFKINTKYVNFKN